MPRSQDTVGKAERVRDAAGDQHREVGCEAAGDGIGRLARFIGFLGLQPGQPFERPVDAVRIANLKKLLREAQAEFGKSGAK